MKNEPSEKAMIDAMEYLMKTSIPRLLAKKERESQRSNYAEIDEEMDDKLPKG